MANIEVQILDYENGVIGTLDITDSENFPLALTYLISDGRDLEQRFGDFSKSFDLPATKNNNTLFRNISNEKIIDDRDMAGFKDCRILVDSINFFKGKIQIKGSKQSSKPLSYSCTIYGGNYGWLSGIRDKNVCDTFDGDELLVNGDFDGNSDGWTLMSNPVGSNQVTYDNGQIVFDTTLAHRKVNQSITDINNQLVVGDTYEVSYEITSYTSGKLEGRVTNSSGDASQFGTGINEGNGLGVWSYVFEFGDYSSTATSINRFWLNSAPSVGFIGTVDNISLKAVKTLEYTKSNIENSWDETQATSDVVYPLINYGEWFLPDYPPYVGPVETSNSDRGHDFRPSFYIYNMLKNMFNNQGYKLESNFIEDNQFKKLICHFPPDSHNLKNQVSEVMISRDYWNVDSPTGGDKGIWDNTISTTDYQVLSAYNANSINSSNWTDTGFMTVKNDKVVSDINGDYDSSTGKWTCPKSGLYHIESVICLVIGNFENIGANQFAKANLKVYVSLWKNGTLMQQTSEDNAKVGHYNFSSKIGRDTTTSATTVGIQPAQYISTTIPMLNCVRAEIDGFARSYTAGDEVEIKVRVKAKAESPSTTGTISGIRWGVASVNDIHLRAPTGQYSVLGQDGLDNVVFPSPGGRPYMNTGSNIANIWERYESPYFKSTIVSNDYLFGERYKYSDILPCNISQIDFIKGVAHLFNLQFRTDMTTNTVYIEPFNEFYKDESLAYDWTNKLDLSKEIEDKYEISLKERLSFQYKNDGSDGLMKYINDSFKELGNEHHFFNYYDELEGYPKGMTKFENPVFSSTWCDWDPSLKHYLSTSSRYPALVPVINKSESIYGWDLSYVTSEYTARPEKIWKYNPRILLYQGNIDSPNNGYVVTGWERVSLSGNTYNTTGSRKTPRATFVDWDNITSDKFTNLSFNDEVIAPPLRGRTQTHTSKGLYSVYWGSMIEQLKRNPRIRVMHINLSTSDIITLDLSKLVYINGTYWRINKIIDYSPLKNTTTKVEFIQWERLESASASDRIGPSKNWVNTFKT